MTKLQTDAGSEHEVVSREVVDRCVEGAMGSIVDCDAQLFIATGEAGACADLVDDPERKEGSTAVGWRIA